MRSGEQFNLHWRCVSTHKDRRNGKEMKIAKVIVDYGTSKKRLEQWTTWDVESLKRVEATLGDRRADEIRKDKSHTDN